MDNQEIYHKEKQQIFIKLCVIVVIGFLFHSCTDEINGPSNKLTGSSNNLMATSENSGSNYEVAANLINYTASRGVSDADFKVFDGTYFVPKPWALKNYGLTDIAMAYPPTLWGKPGKKLEGTTSMPDKERVRKFVRKTLKKGNKYIAINIEHWSLKGSDKRIENSIDRFLRVRRWMKQVSSKVKVGFYSMPPIRSFNNSTKPKSSKRYKKWRANNIKLNRLANHVDAFYPSLYTFNDNKKKWVKEAKRQIEMARELNGDIPVYVFLWPQYHPYNKKFAGKFIPYDFWKLQLQTAREYADGIVIYTPRHLKWNNSAPWWKGVKRLMVNMDKVDWWDEWYNKKYK